MKLGTQIYSAPGIGQKSIQIRYNPDERFTHALNFTGYSWVDDKYKLVKNILNSQTIVVTNQDIIATNDYIEQLNPHITIIFVFQSNTKIKGMNKPENLLYRITNIAFKSHGASKKRLKAAQMKLKELGFKTKFFTSEQTCLNYLAKLK